MNDFLPTAVAESTRQSAIAEQLQLFLSRSREFVSAFERGGYGEGPVLVFGSVDHLIAGPSVDGTLHAPSSRMLEALLAHPASQPILALFHEQGCSPVAMVYYRGAEMPEDRMMRLVGYFPGERGTFLERPLSAQQDREYRAIAELDQQQNTMQHAREAMQEQMEQPL